MPDWRVGCPAEGGAVGTRYVQGLFPESIIPSHRQRTQRAPAMYRRALGRIDGLGTIPRAQSNASHRCYSLP